MRLLTSRALPLIALALCAVAGRSVDISPGGVGMVLAQFLPRMCEGWVRVLHPTSPGRAASAER